MHDVILHAFDWHYSDITARAERIAALGYGAVLVPPPLYSDESGKEWWQRYQPKDYRVLRSYLGDKAGLEDRDRWANSWQRNDITAMIRFHNAVHGLPQWSLYEEDGFIIFARGERGIVAINKTGMWQNADFCTRGLHRGQYTCQLHGHEMSLDRDHFTLAIPPHEAQLWLHAEE